MKQVQYLIFSLGIFGLAALSPLFAADFFTADSYLHPAWATPLNWQVAVTQVTQDQEESYTKPSTRMVRAAIAALEHGDNNARALVLRALESDAADADALYLAALFDLKEDGDVHKAIEDVSQSLGGEFTIYNPLLAYQLLGSLYLRSKQYQNYIAVYRNISKNIRYNSTNDALLSLMYSAALFRTNQKEAALAELVRAKDLFPTDPRFAELFFKANSENILDLGYKHSKASETLANFYLSVLPELSQTDPELLIYALPFIDMEAQRKAMVQAYRATASQSAVGTLAALHYGLITDTVALDEFFSGKYSFKLSELYLIRGLLGTGDSQGFATDQTSDTAATTDTGVTQQAINKANTSTAQADASAADTAPASADANAEDAALAAQKLALESAMQAFDKKLASYTGLIYVDENNDDIVDGQISYTNSKLTSYTVDADQDNHFELAADFSDNVLQKITYTTTTSSMREEIAYHEYPFVNSISYTYPTSLKKKIEFIAKSHSEDLISTEAFPSADDMQLLIPRPALFARPSENARLAQAEKYTVSQGPLSEILSLVKGQIQKREFQRNGRTWSLINYSNGLPAFESIDSDGDGYFETERIYTALKSKTASQEVAGSTVAKKQKNTTKVTSTNTDVNLHSDFFKINLLDPNPYAASIDYLRIDNNHNKKFEYREEINFPFLKEWDIDDDGRYDIRLHDLGNGNKQQDFSTKLNGIFDESIVTDAKGNIISLTQNNKLLKPIADTNPNLMWLGTKKFDLGASLPSQAGLYQYQSYTYYLSYIGDKAYAQLLP